MQHFSRSPFPVFSPPKAAVNPRPQNESQATKPVPFTHGLVNLTLKRIRDRGIVLAALSRKQLTPVLAIVDDSMCHLNEKSDKGLFWLAVSTQLISFYCMKNVISLKSKQVKRIYFLYQDYSI